MNQAQGPRNSEFQAQVPPAQIPIQGPTQIGQNIPVQPPQQPVPMQLAPASMIVPSSPDNLPKLDREETQNSQVSQKRMQNPIILALETGWKPIISQKEKRLDIFA